MTITPNALKLLGDIFARVEGGSPPETEQQLMARLDEPWLLEELMSARLVGFLGTGQVGPTLSGIKRLDSRDARAAESACVLVRDAVSSLFREDPTKARSTDEVAARVPIPKDCAQRALSYIYAGTPRLFSLVLFAPSGLLQTVSFTQAVLADPLPEETEAADSDFITAPTHLSLTDFRCLARIEWSLSGVCLLGGPNGSGKSTMLDALTFLAAAFQKSVPEAISDTRGSVGLRRLGAEASHPVKLSIERAGHNWALELPVDGGGVADLPGETVRVGDKVRVRRLQHSPQWYFDNAKRRGDPQGKTCFRMAVELGLDSFTPLVRTLQDFRRYGGYNVEVLRDGGRGGEHETQLSRFGENALIVLRNWRAAPNRFQNRFSWVVEKMRLLFPGLIDDIDFDPPVGNIVPARFLLPRGSGALPIHRASDGMLVGLLHLIAVAGAPDGAVIAIDELENQLHPHAIRLLIRAMREVASERSLTVILTTHSPVAMNEFHNEPDKFFVMEPGHEVLPVALDQLHDPEWLKQFALGDLYDELRFGAPRPTGD